MINVKPLTHLELFAGIGGIGIAAERAGFETVGQCEMADYPTKVLEKHWPDVPRWRDVRDVTAESFRQRTGLRTVDIISAGYPCQTFSVVGKRTGELDLAEQFIRVVSELRPRWAIGENVGGHVTNGLDDVRSGLEREGYQTRAFVLPASAVGAPHERYRVFVVAHSNHKPVLQADPLPLSIRSEWNAWQDASRGIRGTISESYWTEHQSPICGVDDGTSDRFYKSRMMALGNMVVPQQVYPILKAIADIERGTECT